LHSGGSRSAELMPTNLVRRLRIAKRTRSAASFHPRLMSDSVPLRPGLDLRQRLTRRR
jgi:hypothetical protein